MRLRVRTVITIALVFAFAGIFISHSMDVEAVSGPLNGKIAFVSDRDGNREIYLMNPDGSGQVNITNSPTTDDETPSWSPTGDRIVFERFDSRLKIFAINPDGTNLTQLSNGNGNDLAPDFSPLGNKIAFQSSRDGNNEIYVMNPDGTGQTRLTNNSASDITPNFSPDGKKIVFTTDRDGNNEIYVMNADGSGQTRLTNNSVGDQSPSFSPDGSKIVFKSDSLISLMNADGSNQVGLTTGFDPAFSPDGAKIVFGRNINPNPAGIEIVVRDLASSTSIVLTSNTAFDGQPDFQPAFSPETIGVFRPSSGQFLLRNSNNTGTADLTLSFGQAGDQPLAGDWDGDGKDDVGVFRPSTHQFLLRQPTTCSICGSAPVPITIAINFGQTGDLAVVGDWDSDGVDSPGVYRPSTGEWLLTNSHTNSPRPLNNFFFGGVAGDRPLAGDWNGDGKDTIGIFRSSTNEFFLRNANNFGSPDISFSFGAPGDLPVIGDWNADGIDSVGLFRNGTVFVSNTFVPTVDLTFAFGASGDQPVAADWNGVNNPPNSGVNNPSNGSVPAGQTQTFTTTCSDPDGWRNIATIDFKIAKSDGNGNGVPVVFWVQFDQGRNIVRFYDPDLEIWIEGQPGSNITLSSGYADLYLSGTQVLGSGPTGSSVQVTWSVVFKDPTVKNNYKQYLKITDDFGLTTGFEKVGAWGVTK